jgi:hypothetical protein
MSGKPFFDSRLRNLPNPTVGGAQLKICLLEATWAQFYLDDLEESEAIPRRPLPHA